MDDRNSAVELVERLTRIVANEGHAQGLKPAQWEALRYLARANRFSRTPGALTAYLGLTKGTVSQTLMALERSGFIEKTANPGDARSVRLGLSPAGADLLRRDGIDTLRRAFDGLPAEVQAALGDGLERLVKAGLAARGGRAFGVCRTCRHFVADAGGAGRHFCALLKEQLSDGDAELICHEQEAA
ncbi:MarR family winged helix-turn-helix transcriptional regulator [Aminobacter sp. HY435]|uniref:MarR family winged helix-turn-helix transcriptional regulator n=1 Tax=Aminobacter sp. HY435 TaxID=2970917 RepID=UPI0022B9575B|nr:MarR family transcriptional regulator [Aminobacter sp. HY435]